MPGKRVGGVEEDLDEDAEGRSYRGDEEPVGQTQDRSRWPILVGTPAGNGSGIVYSQP
jgi:hypothetical protein